MVKSYCVKQKKQTDCVPGSGRLVKANNGRMMMKCICAEWGVWKTRKSGIRKRNRNPEPEPESGTNE